MTLTTQTLILSGMRVRATQSADSQVLRVRGRSVVAGPENINNGSATYLDDKQDDWVFHVILARVGSLQDSSLRSGTES
jgi:hypothetical protein